MEVARPLSLRAVNLLGSLVGGGFPRLEIDALQAAARKETGLEDFGPNDYREGLASLLGSANDGDLTTTGRIHLRDAVTRALANRLLWVDAKKRRPDAELNAPVMVVGIPRSGTTYLHRLLCTDPIAQPVLSWQGQRPLPPVHGPDRRVEQASEWAAGLERAAPGIAGHYAIGATVTEDCMSLFDPSLRSLGFFSAFPLWRYQDWYMAADQTPAYAIYRDFLGYLQEPGRRLTLRAPVHSLHLDALWGAIPDAKLVLTQRDPATVAGRLCGVWCALHGSTARKVDMHRLGSAVVSLLTTMVDRSRRARAAHPEKTVIDVTYRELLDAPVETVLGIYAGHDLPVPEGLEARLREIVREEKLPRHSRNEYNLADFGLTADGVRERVR